jgi:hypothetical protein
MGSAFSAGSVLSFASLLSVGSLASISSSGSVLSIASSGSILSIGGSGGCVQIGTRSLGASGEAANHAAAAEANIRRISGLLAVAAIASAPFSRSAAA